MIPPPPVGWKGRPASAVDGRADGSIHAIYAHTAAAMLERDHGLDALYWWPRVVAHGSVARAERFEAEVRALDARFAMRCEVE